MERGLRLLHAPGDVYELRLLKCRPSGWQGKAYQAGGWFDDAAKAAIDPHDVQPGHILQIPRPLTVSELAHEHEGFAETVAHFTPPHVPVQG